MRITWTRWALFVVGALVGTGLSGCSEGNDDDDQDHFGCGNGVKETGETCENTGSGTDSGCTAALPNCSVTCASCYSNSSGSMTNSIGMTLVALNPGTFTMGSPPDEPGRDGDETQHTVTLTRGFYMGQAEVTQGQWQAVMGSNPSFFTGCGSDCPVETVSWFDAVGFCNALSDLEGKSRCYSQSEEGDWIWNAGCTGYRLPTESEWEYAARAGTTTAFANGPITNVDCSPLDPNLEAMGWYCGNSGDTPHEVGQKQANGWGLWDMHGNVWEWCWDRYSWGYPGTASDPTGPTSGMVSRVLRGGSWYGNARHSRSAYRFRLALNYRNINYGLRVVLPR